MTTPRKKWNVLVYLAGDNNLDSAGVTDLTEMKTVGSNADLNIVAQFDRAGQNVTTTRYYLRQGTTLSSDAVQSLGETNMGDPAVLQDFLAWGITEYPADHNLVVLWNHGNGWDDENIYRAAQRVQSQFVRGTKGLSSLGKADLAYARVVATRFRRCLFQSTVNAALTVRGIAYDDQARDFLDNREVKKVLTAIKKKLRRKIDVLGMDACLMNMMEVAYQVRDSVAFVAGSEETEPAAGWPYHTILGDLAANPNMAPRDVSALIVKKYLASYAASSNVTQSALDQSKVAVARLAVEVLGKALHAGLTPASTYQAIHRARTRVQCYARQDYVDLVDYCKQLKALKVPLALKAVCTGVIAAVAPFVVQNGSKGAAVSRSHGVSIYFPTGSVSGLYQTLDFAKKSQWAKFIDAF